MIFLVFEPADSAMPRTPEDAERVVFLREKFSWSALFFGPFWLIWHGLWLALLLWAVLAFAIAVGVAALELRESLMLVAYAIPSLLIAIDATELRRRKLLRQALQDAGVVVAQDIEIAERRFFDAWMSRGQAAPAGPRMPPPPAPRVPPIKPSPVVGLFPEAGAKR
jgi:hypothetical protein